MKQVTIENVKARMNTLELQMKRGDLSLREEFELDCLRELLAMMGQPAPVALTDERSQFEFWYLERWKASAAWAKDYTLDEVTRLRGDDGEYSGYGFIRGCWTGWKARAAMLQGKDEPAIDNTAQQFESLAPASATSKPEPSLDAMERALNAYYATDSVREGMLKAYQIMHADVMATSAGSGKLERCAAAKDGECNHPQCPQLRDNEPKATGRHCPIDDWDDE